MSSYVPRARRRIPKAVSVSTFTVEAPAEDPKQEDDGLDQYFTEQDLAERWCEWLELPRGARVLEPSAGDGTIVRALPKNVSVTAVELDPIMVKTLNGLKRPALEVVEGDFLQFERGPGAFDVAVMNPPYGKGADGRHVAHALSMAKRVSCLVRANFMHGKNRHREVFSIAEVTRRINLVVRPTFHGPTHEAKGAFGARHEYIILELVRREPGDSDMINHVEEEFWF